MAVAQEGFNFDEIKQGHTVIFKINGCGASTEVEYIQTIASIRTIATKDGTRFSNIRNLGVRTNDARNDLIKVIVIYEERVTEFVIDKSNLYLIGFVICPTKRPTERYHLTGYPILGFTDAVHNGRYSNDTTDQLKLGLGAMTEAIFKLHSKITPKEKGRYAEIFMVHLCEAARFDLIKDLVLQTMKPGSVEYDRGDNPNHILFRGIDGNYLPRNGYLDKMVRKLKVKYKADPHKSLQLDDPSVVVSILKDWSHLSEVYYTFALTGTTFLDKETVSKCRISGTECLASIIAVLYNPKLEKYLETWSSKSTDESVTQYNAQDHLVVVREATALHDAGVAFTA